MKNNESSHSGWISRPLHTVFLLFGQTIFIKTLRSKKLPRVRRPFKSLRTNTIHKKPRDINIQDYTKKEFRITIGFKTTMNTIEIMKSRRSVRHFTDKKVPPEHIQQLLEAAMSAPSAYGRRPWHFVVVTEEEVFNQILARPHYSALETAQVGILVCGDLHAEKDEQFLIAGCSTAIENILIAAQSLGLGAVWSSIYPFEKEMLGFQKIFNLPGHILPITFIPVGYPPQKMPVIDRFEEERVHYNRW